MRETSANFDIYNAKSHKNLIFIVKLDGISTYFCSGEFSGITSDYYPYIKSVDIKGGKITPLDYKSQNYGFDFELLDKNALVTGLFNGVDIMKREVTLSIGFAEIAIADFLEFPPLKVSGYYFDPNTNSFKFTCRNIVHQLNQPIFQNMANTKLATDIDEDATAVSLLVNGDMAGTGSPWTFGGGWAHDAVNEEADYTPGGADSLTLASSDFLYYVTAKPNQWYEFTYNITNAATAGTVSITTDFAKVGQTLSITSTGVKTLYFESSATPGDFVIKVSSATAFSITNMSLKLIYGVVDSTTAFTAANSAPWGNSTKTYIKIDSEIFEYTAKGTSPTRFTLSRAQLGTTATAHSIGAIVQEVMLIQDNPYEFLLQILQTGGAGTLTYDIGVDGFGINAGDITDEIQIKNDYNRWLWVNADTTDALEWLIVSPETNASEFIRENILPFIPAYMIYTNEGKIGIKAWDLRIVNEGDVNFSESNIINLNTDVLMSESINRLIVNSEWNGTSHLRSEMFTFDSTPRYDDRAVTFSPKLNNTFGGDFELIMIRMYLKCYHNPPVAVKFTTFLANLTLETGDIGGVSHDNLPHYVLGTKGWTAQSIEILNYTLSAKENSVMMRYEGINFMTHEKEDTVNTAMYLESDIDDTDLILNVTGSEVIQADDAYIQITPLATPDIITVTLEGDLPGGSSSEENITIQIYGKNASGVGVHSYVEKKLYYDARKSGTIRWEARLYMNVSTTVNYVKVDWIAESGAVGEKITNLKFIKCKLLVNKITYGSTVL